MRITFGLVMFLRRVASFPRVWPRVVVFFVVVNTVQLFKGVIIAFLNQAHACSYLLVHCETM